MPKAVTKAALLSACTLDAGFPSQRLVTAGGTPGQRYALTFSFRRVVEQQAYGGSGDGGAFDGGLFVVGRAALGTRNLFYAVDISRPPQTYYLNKGSSGLAYCVEADNLGTVVAETRGDLHPAVARAQRPRAAESGPRWQPRRRQRRSSLPPSVSGTVPADGSVGDHHRPLGAKSLTNPAPN